MIGSEILLYGYGLVCLSMLGFNILYSLHLRVSDRRLKRRMGDIARLVAAQLAVVQAGKKVERRHLKEMGRRLSRVNNLLAFDHFLDEQDDEAPAFRSYLRQMQPVFLYLTTVYRRREDMQAAYFCHFLARHQLQRHMQMQQMQPLVASYLEKGSLYCKINALKALCAFGSAETIVQALLQLDKQADGTLHEKVLTETLMAFTGKADMLIGLLWEQFGKFSVPLQRAILDYIRFKSGDYCEQMLAILQDQEQDRELRFAAIRYFGRYPFQPARALLLDFVCDLDPLHWEFTAISASSLARYSGQDVIDALSEAMHSPNWYVRYNAAASLEAHGLAYEDLVGTMVGEDRYAREMLTYRLERRRLAEKEKEAMAGA